MFWKAGLKITPVYKDSGGSPLSLTCAQAGWTQGQAGGLGPKAGQTPRPEPGAGGNLGQVQSPAAAGFQNSGRVRDTVGVPVLIAFL